ncbi:MAG TPA: methyltransferase [Prolixibacteraceae bacterium]|nr:methyltransferase [Prolixibacteraceae bacterium]
MNSRENLKMTLNHQQPERLVLDFGGTGVTGIHCLSVKNLRNYYGLEDRPVKVVEPFQMLGEVDEELREAMGVDVIGAYGKGNLFGFANNECDWKPFTTNWGQELLVPVDFNYTKTEDGSLIIYPAGDTTVPASARMPESGYFFDAIIRQEPIDENKLNPEDNLEEFGQIDEETLDYWERTVIPLSESGKGTIASLGGTALGDIALVPGMNLKNPRGIRDVAEWYMSTIMRPDYIHAIFEKQTELAMENFTKIYERIGNNIDAVFICGNDFGTQNSTFCSPDQFNELYLPYYKRMNDWMHQNTEWKSFKHSCGAVEPFMPLFIEAGFDIINPVQINAKGMDPRHLKNTYGKDLVFWGGGVDTQKMLSFGTPSEVKKQVLENCEIFAKDGGFVFNTVHNIQANVPVENIVAMLEAIKEFNGE